MKVIKIARLALAGFMFALLATSVAQAAPEFYVSITGAKQGPFNGEVTRKGFEGKSAGMTFDYNVVSPRDVATGMATGKRIHKPIRIKKAWGPSSTQLFTALTTNEALPSVVIDFFSVDPNGMQVLDHTVKLTNAFVASIAHNSETVGGAASLPPTETVEFVFQQIELLNHRTKTVAIDSMLAP